MGQKYVHSLEGVRAYAFLVVFAVHYSAGMRALPQDGGPFRWAWFLACQASWTAVPIFFVLSGYLITGVLFDTRDLSRFFRTFYARRALRVLPLYYLFLACTAGLVLLGGLTIAKRHVLYLVYLHNFHQGWEVMYRLGNYVELGHLWSLAVEEQFYLIWPVVIYLVRSRTRLLGCCYGVIALATIARLLWPLTHMSYYFAYECSFTRCDALMMGAALALHRRGPMPNFARLIRPAKIVAVSGIAFVLIRAVWSGDALPMTGFGLMVLVPVVNLVATAIIILVLEPTTLFSRMCSKPWAVRVGSMSYSLYIVHEPLAPWFRIVLLPRLAALLHDTRIALLVMMVIAFALTYAVSLLTYRYVELPALRWKNRFRYGPVRVKKQAEREGTVPETALPTLGRLSAKSVLRSAS